MHRARQIRLAGTGGTAALVNTYDCASFAQYYRAASQTSLIGCVAYLNAGNVGDPPIFHRSCLSPYHSKL